MKITLVMLVMLFMLTACTDPVPAFLEVKQQTTG